MWFKRKKSYQEMCHGCEGRTHNDLREKLSKATGGLNKIKPMKSTGLAIRKLLATGHHCEQFI